MQSTTKQSTLYPRSPESIVSSATYVGAGTGLVGAAVAAGNATLKGRPVILWSAIAGGQCCALGFTFWLSRRVLTDAARSQGQTDAPNVRENLMYSSVAGSMAGMVGGALRGRSNILPGAIVFGLVGLGGQASVSALTAMIDAPRDERPLLDRLSNSKWWPLKSIPDADYESELQDKLVALEAEIEMVDGQIDSLKRRQQETKNTLR